MERAEVDNLLDCARDACKRARDACKSSEGLRRGRSLEASEQMERRIEREEALFWLRVSEGYSSAAHATAPAAQ